MRVWGGRTCRGGGGQNRPRLPVGVCTLGNIQERKKAKKSMLRIRMRTREGDGISVVGGSISEGASEEGSLRWPI